MLYTSTEKKGVVLDNRPSGWSLGAGVHVITGGTRVSLKRVFDDLLYSPVSQRAEISYSGVGFSAGAARSLGRGVAASAMIRLDGSARIDRDSTEVGRVDLPVTLGGALRWRAAPRLDLATSVTRRSWSGADDDLQALGGTGSRNTFEWNAGAEWLSYPRRPSSRPLRIGGHYRTLPFPVESGAQPKEFGLSLGSALGFARDPQSGMARAQVDLSLSRVWRSATGGYREGAGRPPESGEASAERVTLRLTPDERARYQAAADAAELNLGAWIRRACEHELKRG